MRRKGSQASRVAQRVLSTHEGFFRTHDFEAIPPAVVARELRRLAVDGELRRIRKGLYWRGQKTMLGIAPPALSVLLNELVGETTYGPAGVSAANALGLTSQVTACDQIAVNGRPPQDLPNVHFVQRSGRRGRKSERLSPHEVGLIEVLASFHDVVDDPSSALQRLSDLLREGAFRRDALLAAAKTEPPRVRRALISLTSGDIEAARANLEVTS